ncbi:MAG TPA: hypothetical protein VK465_15000 [Fibrobacteria bacterium]|nr:hypothetical protein [Fibrobacteria bacterium]
MDSAAKLEFLRNPATLDLLAALGRDPREELALSGDARLKSLPAPRRIALLEQRKLRQKARGKCPEAMDMLFTPLGLEQLTHAALARHKAARLPPGLASLADICCGMGGDSMAVPPQVKVVGVDSSRAALLAYRHNVSLKRAATAVLGDAGRCPARAEAAYLDPARRPAGQGDHWDEDNLSPGWGVMESLVSRFGNMAIKLGPGSTPATFLEEHEWEYLGLEDECLELTIWTGALGRPGLVKATELPEGASVEAWRDDIADSFGRVEAPGAWLFEPVKAVVRAHLFGVLAARHGLWQIDPRIAYLSGNEPVKTPLLKAYKVIRELPFDLRAVRNFLRGEEVGRLEVKKRGVGIVPEEVRAGLKLAGPNEGTLIFTRVMERKAVFWARAETWKQ